MSEMFCLSWLRSMNRKHANDKNKFVGGISNLCMSTFFFLSFASHVAFYRHAGFSKRVVKTDNVVWTMTTIKKIMQKTHESRREGDNG